MSAVSGAAMEALEALAKPLSALGRRLEAILEDAPDWLDSQARARVEGAINGLTWRRETVAAWIALLGRIGGVADPDFVDWLAIDRIEGREFDIGLHRHWLDPTRPLAKAVLEPAHGVLVTSATLRGSEGWPSAEARTGAMHLPGPTGLDDLKMLAFSRLMLDNVPNVKAYWIMMGMPLAAVALHFGANDVQGTVVREEIFHAAGARTETEQKIDELVRFVREAGRIPVQRDTLYHELRRWS